MLNVLNIAHVIITCIKRINTLYANYSLDAARNVIVTVVLIKQVHRGFHSRLVNVALLTERTIKKIWVNVALVTDKTIQILAAIQ